MSNSHAVGLLPWRHLDLGSHIDAIYVGEGFLDVGIDVTLRFQPIQRRSGAREFSPCLNSTIGPEREGVGPDFYLPGERLLNRFETDLGIQ